ncbi:MAG TPA: hypothetical protein VHG34_03490 [Nitrososphaeraceae archaeon]|nr:hypothetical protein [Nitrososphaeraceae archaeon]
MGNTTYIGIPSGINYSICFIYTYFTNGLQQHQKPLSFGQTSPEESVTDEQTFRSAFDTLFLQNGRI